MTRMTESECAVMCNLINTHTHTHTHTPDCVVMCNLINTHTHPPWEDQCEWHIMTRMTGGPDCVVMCNLINTYIQTYLGIVAIETAVANSSRCAVPQQAPRPAGDCSCGCMFWGERGGRHTRQPVGPSVDAAIMTTILSTNRVDSRRFSSRSCAFRRTHTSTDPIRLLCIGLALPLTLSLPSRFAPGTKLMVDVSPRAPRFAGASSRDCTFLGCRGGVLTINRQPMGPLVNTAAITTATGINHVDSGSFSSRCCTFRRPHTSADPIQIFVSD